MDGQLRKPIAKQEHDMMKRLILLHGHSLQGKTYLAQKLKDEHAFEMLSLDDLYVERIDRKSVV